MKILITGGAGFIGSHLTDRLTARGDQVLVIDNYSTGRRDNLKHHELLTIIEGTIADEKLVEDAFSGFKPELVIHAAASYKDPDNWEEDIRTNCLGTSIIVHAAKRYTARRIIYFQTALCYGLHPIEQPITLNHPIISGGSSYAISKTTAEQYIELSGADYISFRLANAYGPRNISGPLPTFFHRLSTGKPCFVMDTRRDFIFISDLVDCVMMAVDGRGKRGPYHISSGRDYAIKELFDATIKALDLTTETEVEVRQRGIEDAYTILLDPTKTTSDFAPWNISTPLEEGVRLAIEYYKAYGIQETFTHLRIPERKEED
ncbi:MAG: NAD-dependent epimerase/dehydratase family protein [Desulfomonilia bacterium]